MINYLRGLYFSTSGTTPLRVPWITWPTRTAVHVMSLASFAVSAHSGTGGVSITPSSRHRNGVTLDLATVAIGLPVQHYAFVVREEEFEEILARLTDEQAPSRPTAPKAAEAGGAVRIEEGQVRVYG